jgi:hypothetical protein
MCDCDCDCDCDCVGVGVGVGDRVGVESSDLGITRSAVDPIVLKGERVVVEVGFVLVFVFVTGGVELGVEAPLEEEILFDPDKVRIEPSIFVSIPGPSRTGLPSSARPSSPNRTIECPDCPLSRLE